MPEHDDLQIDPPYDDEDEGSIIRYAGRLTGRTLGELVHGGEAIIGGLHTKGSFGMALEREYFLIPNNSRAEPDFVKVGLELKVAPMKDTKDGLVSKERMVLGIIDYNEVPEKGFDIFLGKNSHILMVFYHWVPDTDIHEYRVLKVVDWRPTKEELRLIRSDWDIIEGYIMRGEAELLSERHTMYLAANVKGVGHDSDYRSQPFSDVPAKQRSLSFKVSFMNMIYCSHADVNDVAIDDGYDTIFKEEWPEQQSFEDYVSHRLDRFVGMSCREIERALGLELCSKAKNYYHILTLAMFGVFGKRHIREFEEAGISLKTIRLRADGRSKESMSFPAFKYEEIVEQTWETSDFLSQIDHKFFSPVFQFPTRVVKGVNRKELIFRGGFIWQIPDGDFETIRDVWEDTRQKVLDDRIGDFVKRGEGRISHVRPHGKNSSDTYPYKGKEYTKRCFWLNDTYIARMAKENLDLP